MTFSQMQQASTTSHPLSLALLLSYKHTHTHTHNLSATHPGDDATEGKAQRNQYDSEAISQFVFLSRALHSSHSGTQAHVSAGLGEKEI